MVLRFQSPLVYLHRVYSSVTDRNVRSDKCRTCFSHTEAGTACGVRRLISIRYQKECVESKWLISCRMMHYSIKIYHVVPVL